MVVKLLRKKHILTGILAAAGIGIIVFYTLCDTSCRYLKGAVWGIDLKYLGLLLMAIVLLLKLINWDIFCLLLLSFGVGGEIFLVGYQIKNDVYCAYCLAFGAVLVLMFAINFKIKKLLLVTLSIIAGLLFFLFAFKGSLTPVYAGENLITSFGSGKITVRLYTDYFCGPCRAAEPEIEALLVKLMEKNLIRLTFIDTPTHDTPEHKESSLYARYFLYLLNASQRLFPQALQTRAALYEAAMKKIVTVPELESFLAQKGLKFKPFDTITTFNLLRNHMKDDRIQSTPTCVVVSAKGKEVFVGGNDIIKRLKSIAEAK